MTNRRLVVTDRSARVLGVAAAFAALTLMLPAALVVYDMAVDDAKAYCEAHAPRDAATPALAQPGFSVRYDLELVRSGDTYRCKFPDPVGGRVHWVGESSDDGRWVWEKLVD